MALVPGALTSAEQEQLEELVIQPSRTYRIENGRIRGTIDGQLAIEQFIWKAISTALNRFIIYDDQYGCELDNLIGATVTQELIDDEIPRVVEEALVYDDRIDSVNDIILRHEGDTMFISFRVALTTGEQFESEVSV